MPSPIIRPARREDSGAIARLFQISSYGVADYVWSKLAEPGESLLEVGTRRYAREGVAFSYQNCLIAEDGGQVIGMMHSYPMASEPDAGGEEEPDPVLRPYAELEVPGSLYISGLACFPDHRGKGIGTRLLARADDRARSLGLDRLSLIVFEQTEGPLRLYLRTGYREIDRRPIVPHEMIRGSGDAILMAKDLGSGDEMAREQSGKGVAK